MTNRSFVSRFSPNRTAPEVLEAIFVQRHRLAEVWLERLRDSVMTSVKHHLLAVGPRGCGKSHLVALLVSRLRKDPAVLERVRIAWLPEDETTPSFWKFLLRILRALNAEYGNEFPPPPRDGLSKASNDRRSTILSDYLLEKLAGRMLLVVVENLDEVMRGLKDEGQKRWRAFLQEHKVAITLSTSQQLTKDLSDRSKPFFNFFQIEHLQLLSADEALALLRKIADHTGKTELAAFLQSPVGRARIRAIRHIAGGSHRVFIILSEFATREKLEDLVMAFEELLDELTPYYLERLRWLPDQQREIVEFLCRQARTVRVKEIATELFLTEQSAAAQLKSLKQKRYVIAESVGRESRYELAEPLMRLCVEVKDSQREPIRLIVEFLRIWYDQSRVTTLLGLLPASAEKERSYFRAALRAFQPGVPNPVALALKRDLDEARARGDLDEVVCVLVDRALTEEDASLCLETGIELSDLDRNSEALIVFDRAIEIDPANATAWYSKGLVLFGIDSDEKALTAFCVAIELNDKEPEYWWFLAMCLAAMGKQAESVASFDRAIELDHENCHYWHGRGMVNIELGNIKEAIDDLSQAIELNGALSGAFDNLTEAYIFRGDWVKASQVLQERFQLSMSEFNDEESWYTPKIIVAIFCTATDRIVGAQRAAWLVDIALKAKKANDTSFKPNPLTLLGNALVRSLAYKPYTNSDPDTLEAWATVWQETAEKSGLECLSDLALPVRLFGVGVRYLRDKDERVLLDLVQEERAILRDLFRLDDKS